MFVFNLLFSIINKVSENFKHLLQYNCTDLIHLLIHARKNVIFVYKYLLPSSEIETVVLILLYLVWTKRLHIQFSLSSH